MALTPIAAKVSISVSYSFFYVGTEICIAVLQAMPDSFHTVSPQSVYQLVFPAVASLGNGLVFLVNQNSFDSC